MTTADKPRDRAVSTVVGAVLLFGIAIVAWSIYQGFIVPDQNEQAEFEHNRKAQTQMLNVKDAMLRTGSTGVPQSVTVQVGAEYARRSLAVNLGITGGAIRTRNTTDDGSNTLILDNVTALDGETKDYISDNVTVQTKSLVYEPIYSNYKGAPQTVITGGAAAVINERTKVGFDNYNFSIADQVAIKGQTITVVAIAGNLSQSVGGQSSSITVDTEALSVAERSVSIKKASGTTNITLSIPTQIKDQSVWQDSAGFGSATAVKNVSRNGDRINVTLKNQQYTLRMMKVGVGSGASDPGAEYITDVDTPKSIAEDTTAQLTYEVRDKFNNPVDGVRVNASMRNVTTGSDKLAVDGTSVSTTTEDAWISGNTSDGKLVLNYTAPDIGGSAKTVRVNVTILDNSSVKENVSTTFKVFNADGSGTNNGGSATINSTSDINAGSGGDSSYPSTQSQTITNSGGEWTDVTGVDAINLSVPRFAATQADTYQSDTQKRYLKLGLGITNGSYTYYVILTPKEGISYQTPAGSSWQNGNVQLIKQDDAGSVTSKSKSLNASTITPQQFKNGEEMNLLDSLTVDINQDPSKTYNQILFEIRDMLRTDTNTIFITDMHGRVIMSLNDTTYTLTG